MIFTCVLNIQAFQTVTLHFFFPREDESGSDFEPSVEANSRQKNTSAETARMFKLRRSLHQLASFRMQKENEVLRARSGAENQNPHKPRE